MIEKLTKLLLKEYSYELESHKVCYEDIKKSKIIVPAITLFLILAGIYFTTGIFDLVVLGFAFFILVLIPLALRKGETYDVVVITPELLIKQKMKNEVVAIAFDNIKKFGTDKTGVVLSDGKKSISLDPAILADDILIIIEILEAKGKTFDKTKDFMIRPIEVVIKDNKVSIVDVEVEETSTEKIVSETYKDYAMLTPGFINDIILMNSVVEETYIKEDNLYLKLSSFEVNPGHPENTMFDSQVATDCIIIFENVVLEKMSKKEARGSDEEVIDTTLENLVVEIEKGVISDWKYLKNGIDLQFSVGLYVLRTSFKYTEVIIGWNKFN